MELPTRRFHLMVYQADCQQIARLRQQYERRQRLVKVEGIVGSRRRPWSRRASQNRDTAEYCRHCQIRELSRRAGISIEDSEKSPTAKFPNYQRKMPERNMPQIDLRPEMQLTEKSRGDLSGASKLKLSSEAFAGST
jgi:hypothetical protein